MHDEPPHIVGDVAQADFDGRPVDADGSDFHTHAVLLVGEDVLNEGPDLRPRGVAAPYVARHRFARRLFPMDVADKAASNARGVTRVRSVDRSVLEMPMKDDRQ